MRPIFIIAIFLASTVVRADVTRPDVRCVEPEKSFFTCQTAKKKWISLCGVLPGMLQYRFGRQGRAEFSYPEKSADYLDSFRFAHYSRFQTEYVEVTFNNQDVDYAVFDYTEANKHRAGVRVTTHDGKEHEFGCVGQIASSLPELKQVLSCDADNALNGG